MKKTLAWSLVVALSVVWIVGFDRWQQSQNFKSRIEAERASDIELQSIPQVPVEPAIRYPVIQAPLTGDTPEPLPSLQDSDAELAAALSALLGRNAVIDYFYPDRIVRRIVATIDHLPQQSLATQVLPVKPVAGKFLVAGDEDNLFVTTENFARYQNHVRLFEMVDVKKMARLYALFYPLFQQAYQDLGYPNGYFNDRLIAVIDHLLATPNYHGVVNVVQPRVFYQFADQYLKQISAGQKILIRIGPENAARVKAKLREIRLELARM